VVVLSGGRPYTLVLFRSVALVVCLKRKNVTPEFAGAIFGIRVLAEFAPRPGGVVGAGAVLVDGTICPTGSRWIMRAPSSVIFDVVATRITCPLSGPLTSMA
jgi:hypothetical protein